MNANNNILRIYKNGMVIVIVYTLYFVIVSECLLINWRENMKIIDFHCDTISCLHESGSDVSLLCNTYCVDIQKLQVAGALAQFFALYINMEETDDPLETTLKMLDRFYKEIEDNAGLIAVARNLQELEQNRDSGKISAFLTIEEGGALKGDMANLRNFYRLGVRLITLTWNYPNEIGFPNYKGTYSDRGLTDFGCDVVREMNRLGMIVDVSHLSDQGFFDVARISDKPFVASHSNARTITDHTRNLTDDMIRVLAEKGGVTGINFANDFLGISSISRIPDMIAHIKQIRKVGGIDVIALGSDFDGINSELEIENMGEMHKLWQALEQNGFHLEEIEKIFYKNAIRIIQDCL